MLEKHLGHLKKMPDGFDTLPQSASSIHQGSHSIKDETSPAHSPSTVSNWASPNQFQGISPSNTGQFTQQVNPGFGMEQGNMQYASPPNQLNAVPRVTGHRRQISDISGVDDIGSDPKRARMYATTNAAMNQMRRV